MSEPLKLCECGCGKPTNIARITNSRRGVIAGQPNRFLPGHYARVAHETSESELVRRREHVTRLYLDGKTLTEIAAAVGAKRMQVHSDVVTLRKEGVLPPAQQCKATTNNGRRCRAYAALGGFCGGHGSAKSGRPRSTLPMPVDDLRRRYEDGETIGEISADTGIGSNLLTSRLREAGVEIRPRGCARGKAPWRLKWLKTEEIIELWDRGASLPELSRKFGVPLSTIWGRLREARRDSTDWRLRRLYVDEELPLGLVAQFLGLSKYQVVQRLGALDIEIRRPGRSVTKAVADKDTIQRIRTAAAQRRVSHGASDLTEKQAHLLDVVRASPEPISSKRITDVCRCLPRKWKDLRSVNSSLRSLERRGLVCSVTAEGAGHFRGRPVAVWFPTDHEASQAASAEDARRLREIQILVEDQERDEVGGGYERGHWADKSIDAPIAGTDAFTILDTLGDEDEALADLMEEYA